MNKLFKTEAWTTANAKAAETEKVPAEMMIESELPYRSSEAQGYIYSKENFPKILKLSEGLADICNAHSATPGQVSLAWLLAQGDNIIPIPATTKIMLEENIAAADVKLTAQDLQDIRQVAKDVDATDGDRYPPGYVEQLFVETPQL
ncbi:hypothetical protein FIBSPDRAFT_961104 [Athelia psychrophila]|uniref:NADP-dependent oxidoreductase domain-containing protein n=1 Tax=Athelia psychrophila TaxID=1759441 RepID=A0A166BM59_9AGAM|nr:hypothetical protein FIBSPDRAFT_961104 [Fibularhizoctonia sp. CBS 109695]